MPDKSRRSQARLLAPLALVAFVITLALVLGGSLGSDDGDSAGDGPAETTESTTLGETAAEPPEKPLKRVYTVKAGDNLDLIAEKTDVPADTLQELNPEVDPQALVIGEKITLRE
jgi:LysM repeat protein